MFRWTKQQPEAHSGHQGSAPSMVPNDGLDLLTITDFIGSHDRRHVEAAIRRRCHTVWIDPETTLCRILGRYKFFVDSRDIGLAPHLMLDGYWEFWISDFIWRNLRPGFRVLDVGANLGYYTVLAADLVGPQGQVTAFEPNPRMFELLQRNAGINGFSQWTDCSARAVSCRTGDRLDFSAAIADPKNGALVDAGSAALAAPGRLNITVETTTLDDACPSPVDFVKIDVEGAEEDLWAGMQQVIDRSPRIQILLEFNALRCRAPERMIESMASRFPLRRVGDDALVHACSAAELLAAKADTMLYLSHGIPLDYATPSAPDQG